MDKFNANIKQMFNFIRGRRIHSTDVPTLIGKALSRNGEIVVFKRIFFKAYLKIEHSNKETITKILRGGLKRNKERNITSCLTILNADELDTGVNVIVTEFIEGLEIDVDALFYHISNHVAVESLCEVDHSFATKRKYEGQHHLLRMQSAHEMSKFKKLHLIQSNDHKNIFIVNDTNVDQKFVLKEITNDVRDNNEYNMLTRLKDCDGIIDVPSKIEENNRINLIYKMYECDLYELINMVAVRKSDCSRIPGCDIHEFIDMINHYCKRCFCQLIYMLKNLRINSIVHRDFKLENILVDHCGNLFVTDFEMAKEMSQPHKLPIAGTICYMAPEVIRHGMYSFESDLWAVGVIIYEMWNDKLPWEILERAYSISDSKDIYKEIVGTPFNKKVGMPIELLNILEKIFVPVKDRITINEVIESKYFVDTNWDELYNTKTQFEDLQSIIKQNGVKSKIYDKNPPITISPPEFDT